MQSKNASSRSILSLKSGGQFALAAVSLAAAVLLAPAGVKAAPPDQSSEGPWAKGRLLVMPKPGLSETELGKIVGAHGAKAQKLTSFGLYVVELPSNASEKATAALLAHNPHLKFVELDRQVPGDLTPNDPYFGSQWHLPKIGGPDAWNTSEGNGVIIAVLDSGIDPTHVDLQGRLVSGYNFVDGNSNTADVRGHGTWVAGSVAASINNGSGVASVAGQAKIMPIRVSDSTGYVYWSTMAKGLTYAADNGARVANMSFNGVAGSSAVLSAAKYMKDKGGLSFVSAGNSNIDPAYASTDVMIIVAATDSADAKAGFSNFGPHVHMSAPGVGIYSTAMGGTYASVSGTSFSAPITAGVAALIMAANPSLSNTQVQSIIFSTATDLGDPGRDIYYGYGRVNAAAAVAKALNTTVVSTNTDTQAPTASIGSPSASSSVSGVTPVSVMVSDNVGVSKAELLVNGTVYATDTSAPFGFSWDTAKVANGMVNLSLRAYDAAGNVGQSTTVSVNVANNTVSTVADATAPAADFTSPFNGAKVNGNVSITAAGSDNAGVAGLKMALFLNGTQVAASSGSSTIKYTWNTRKAAPGTHTLRVDASDAAGNRSSKTISVTR